MALYRGKKTKRARRKRSMYSSNYKYKRSTRIWRNILVVVICAAIFAVGFFLLGPALERVVGAGGETSSNTDSQPVGSSDASSELPPPSDADSSDVVTSEPITSEPAEDSVNSAYLLTADVFTDPAKLTAAIRQAKNGGADTVMLELKGYDGMLNYRSELETVNRISAVTENAVDLSAVIGEIKAAGLDCGAYLQVYDEVYTASMLRDTAIKYNGSETTRWFDYARPEPSAWQDPGVEAAKTYELDIIRELCGYELSGISLGGCHYPVWGSLSGCTYDQTRTKVENITQFISDARALANLAGVKLDVTVSVDIAVGDTHSRYGYYGYPENIFSLDCDSVTVDLRLDDIITSYYPAVTVGEVAYSDLTADRDLSLTGLYTAASDFAGDRGRFNVLTDDIGSTAESRLELLEGLGAEGITCQIGS